MRKQLYHLCLLGILALMLSTEGHAQFRPGEKGQYMFENCFFRAQGFDHGWLQLEGQPSSFRKTKLVVGERAVADYTKFLCFPRGNAYHFQFHFSDENNTWGVLEIEPTLKKGEGEVYLVRDDIKDENYIIHPQRFLIQEAPQGVFIRTMDGRYLRYDPEKKGVILSSEDPANYKEHEENKFFMWSVSQAVSF